MTLRIVAMEVENDLNLPPLKKKMRSPELKARDYVLWLRLFGERGAGKSILAHRLQSSEESFRFEYHSLMRAATTEDTHCHFTREYKGAHFDLHLWDSAGRARPGEEEFTIPRLATRGLMYETTYHYACQALLICFDASAALNTQPLQRLETLYLTLRERIQALEFFDAQRVVYFIGCKTDLVPSLIYDGWVDARTILVAMKPSIDYSCTFGQLLPEILDHIILFWIELRALDLGLSSTGCYAAALAHSYSRGQSLIKRDLEYFAAKHNRPVYLTSTKLNFGCNNLLNSLLQNILVTYGEEKDGMLTDLQLWDETYEQLETALREDPYCIRPPKL